MTNQKKPLSFLQAFAAIVFLSGPLAWLWTGEWKWVVTNLAISLMLIVLDASLTKTPTN